jgi:hypothetical protein
MKTAELAEKLQPFIVGWLSDMGIAGGGGGGFPGPHALNSSYHTGLLADSQATQFLKHDGTRALTADWNVGAFDLTAVDITATNAFLLGGANINAAGTLSNVAYLNANNTLTGDNTFSGVTTFNADIVVAGGAQAVIGPTDTTPGAFLEVNTDTSTDLAFLAQASGRWNNVFTIDTYNNRVWLYATSATRRFEVTDSANPQMRLNQSGTYYTDFHVDGTGTLLLYPVSNSYKLMNGTDYVEFYHNGADTWIMTNDGYFNFQSLESGIGTYVNIRASTGGDDGYLRIYCGDEDEYAQLRQISGALYITTNGVAPSRIHLQHGANAGVRCFGSSTVGETESFDVSGYSSGDTGIRHFSTQISATRANTVAFSGVSYLTAAMHLLPATGDTYDIGEYDNLWQEIWASQLNTVLFALNTVSVTGGRWMIPHLSGTLTDDVISTDTQIDFGTTMAPGDLVLIRAMYNSLPQYEVILVGSLVSGNNYNVTRGADSSGADDWAAGTAWVNIGQAANNDGYISFDATTYGPRMIMYETGAAPSGNKKQILIGDLQNSYGYPASQLYGVAIGHEDEAHITLEGTNGLRFKDSGGSTVMQLDTSGNFYLQGMMHIDTGGALRIGSGVKDSTLTGWYMDTTEIVGQAAGVEQVTLNSSGKIIVGGDGSTDGVTLDVDGITLHSGSAFGGTSEQIKFESVATIDGYHGTGTAYLRIDYGYMKMTGGYSLLGTWGGYTWDVNDGTVGISLVNYAAAGPPATTIQRFNVDANFRIGNTSPALGDANNYPFELWDSANADYVGIDHDSTDAQFYTSDGYFYFNDDEGNAAKTINAIYVEPSTGGTTTGFGSVIRAYGHDGVGGKNLIQLQCQYGSAYLTTSGANGLRIENNADTSVLFFAACGDGVSQVIRIYGKHSTTIDNLAITVNNGEASMVTFDGVNTYKFLNDGSNTTIRIYDSANTDYMALSVDTSGYGYITTSGPGPNKLRLQYNGANGATFFEGSGTGVSSALQIYGDKGGTTNYLNFFVNRNVTGEAEVTGDISKIQFDIPILHCVKTYDISAPPTDAQIDAATGLTPASAGMGYTILLNDSDSNNNYLVWSDGVVWRWVQGTAAT